SNLPAEQRKSEGDGKKIEEAGSGELTEHVGETAVQCTNTDIEVGPHAEEESKHAGRASTQKQAVTRLELGQWAEERLREVQVFAGFLRAGRSPEELREQFPRLFSEVIDRWQEPKRKTRFEAAQGRSVTVPDLLEWIADVKEMSGATMNTYRKEYRRMAGIQRRR